MKYFLPLLAFVCSISASEAQQRNIVFDEKVPITFLGLDFTAAKFIGDEQRFSDPDEIQRLLRAWNDLLINEEDKFDVALALKRKRVTYDFDLTNARNAALPPEDFYSNEQKDHFRFTPADIQPLVSTYDFNGKEGVGLMFVVESFSKLNLEASVFVTFINLPTGEVIFTNRMVAPPGGMGPRNYWGNTIYKIIERIKKKEYEIWRKKYFLKV